MNARAWMLVLAACAVAAGAASLALGQDANWDLRNYHYYNPWALLNGRWRIDIAPAQVQTFYNPVGDLPFYFLSQALPARGVAIAMALPVAIAAFFLARIAHLVLPSPWLAAIAVVAGMTGAAGMSVIGSTMNEWPSTALIVAGLYLALRGRRMGWAGFLVGCAAGLKLAYGPFAVGIVAAMLVEGTARERIARAWRMGLFVLLGWATTGGAWAAFLFLTYGDPVFPYYNGIFKSAEWLPMSFQDGRHGPKGLLQWLAFPLYFSRGGHGLVVEVGFRDYRMVTMWALGAVALAWWLVRGRGRVEIPRAWRMLVAFTVAAYIAWIVFFHYYRYTVPFEMLAGVFVCGAASFAFGRRPAVALAVAVILATLLVGTTRRMGWERRAFGADYFAVTVPPVDAGALVILAGNVPMSYAVPFFPKDARFVSPTNNFLRLGQPSAMAKRAEEAIRAHRGPLYMLEPAQPTDEGPAILDYFALGRLACAPIRSNIDYDALRLCSLTPHHAPAARRG